MPSRSTWLSCPATSKFCLYFCTLQFQYKGIFANISYIFRLMLYTVILHRTLIALSWPRPEILWNYFEHDTGCLEAYWQIRLASLICSGWLLNRSQTFTNCHSSRSKPLFIISWPFHVHRRAKHQVNNVYITKLSSIEDSSTTINRQFSL